MGKKKGTQQSEQQAITAHACVKCEAEVPDLRWNFLLKQLAEGKIPTEMICTSCQSEKESHGKQYGPPKGVVKVANASHAAIAMADFAGNRRW